MKKQQISWMQNLRKMIGYGEKKTTLNNGEITLDKGDYVVELKTGGFNKGNLNVVTSEGSSKKECKDYIKFDMVGVKNGEHHGKKISVTFRDGYVRQMSDHYKLKGNRYTFKSNGFRKKTYSEDEEVEKISIDYFLNIASKWKGWSNWEIKNLRTNVSHPYLKKLK